jgi:hypothetical protein
MDDQIRAEPVGHDLGVEQAIGVNGRQRPDGPGDHVGDQMAVWLMAQTSVIAFR